MFPKRCTRLSELATECVGNLPEVRQQSFLYLRSNAGGHLAVEGLGDATRNTSEGVTVAAEGNRVADGVFV